MMIQVLLNKILISEVDLNLTEKNSFSLELKVLVTSPGLT